ncbi:hypothetical protein E2320_014692, partial [Naja naja]
REVDAGDEIKIPCDLKGAQLTWYWIPRYPICAGLKMGRIEICNVISNTMHINKKLKRFQRMMAEKNNGKSFLTVRFQHMNDSGTFYCFNGRRNSSFLSVMGMTVDPPEKSHRRKQSVKLICNSCDDNMDGQTHESSRIIWTINRKNASNHGSLIRLLRTTIIVEDSPSNYGLWKCSNPRCLTQSDGYCLEDEFRISEKSETDEMI